ncbi:MAG: hypothetical protein KatS3mg110_2157 [Pirellulaceae bacterium]|nr:MAG: hypothetical protein KatS3mg110_2157 [Pirellulaceae bacterium]
MVDSRSAIGVELPVTDEPKRPVGSKPRRARRLFLWGTLGVAALLIAWITYRAAVGWYVRQLAGRCHEAWRTGQFVDLEKMAREWVRWDRSQAQPFLYLADAAQKRGDYRAAVRWLDQLPTGDPKTVPALVEQTTLLFGPLNDPLEGERACLRVLELEPAAVEPRQRLIFYYAQTLQRHKMIDQIREAIRVGSDTREDYVYLIGAYYLVFSNGAEQNHHWLKNYPDNEHFLVARALHLIGSGIVGDEAKDDPEPKRIYDFQRQQMVKEHEAVLLDYMRRFPQNLELLNYFLWQAMTNGEIQRVAELLKQVPDSAAGDGRFWRYKGWLLSAQKKFREAEQAYRKALECHPFDYPSHHQLAQVLRHLGRESEVAYIQNLGERGNELRRELLQLPNARAVTDEQLARIAAYIEDCGDQPVADALKRRLRQATGIAAGTASL